MCREGFRHQEVVTLYIVSVSTVSTKRLGTELSDVRGASGTKSKRSWRRRVVRGSSLQVRFPPVCIAVRVRSREPASRPANCRLAVDMRGAYISDFICEFLMVMTDFSLQCRHKSGKTVKTTTFLSFDVTMFILRGSY